MGFLHSEFAWKSDQWIFHWVVTIGFFFSFYKGSWHGVFKLLGFLISIGNQSMFDKSDVRIMTKVVGAVLDKFKEMLTFIFDFLHF